MDKKLQPVAKHTVSPPLKGNTAPDSAQKKHLTADNNVPAKWRVHTPGLLREVLSNKGAEALRLPISIFGHTLYELAERASEINDPKLNALMMRLTLYEVADPYSKDHDPAVVKAVLEAGI